VLLRSEAASLLRDASTPAQLGSLAAVFLLDLMNVRLLPGANATQRDLVAGLHGVSFQSEAVATIPGFSVERRAMPLKSLNGTIA
jgi:hypothetical protein